ncbi:MAG TPA: ABC transporter permease [Oceanithermus profundus]|uniref:ABC transporter permease n=1 Tax=Oceanithermus profundus TaxID=187137 RepID=A0A7C4Z5H7_9DEIN|nr:ABC transporter permease [Oceanithermus profundus]
MLNYIIRRALQIPLVLFVLSLIIVGLMQLLSPQQRAAAFITSDKQIEHLDQIIEKYHLDEGFIVQYKLWAKEVLHGNLGFSRISKEPVTATVRKKLPASTELALSAFIPIVLMGIWLGTLAATHRDGLLDQVLRVVAIIGWSLPTFVVAIWLVAWVYGGLGWFGIGRLPNSLLIDLATGNFHPHTGMFTIDGILNGRLDVTWAALVRLVLPATALVIVVSAGIMRVMRSSMLDELGKDYVRTARAKGLPEGRVVYKHARRNALIPVITMAGPMLGRMIGGIVVIELIFNFPGLGEWAAKAALQLDMNTLLAFVLLIGLIMATVNLLVDIAYVVVDPRIRYE